MATYNALLQSSHSPKVWCKYAYSDNKSGLERATEDALLRKNIIFATKEKNLLREYKKTEMRAVQKWLPNDCLSPRSKDICLDGKSRVKPKKIGPYGNQIWKFVRRPRLQSNDFVHADPWACSCSTFIKKSNRLTKQQTRCHATHLYGIQHDKHLIHVRTKHVKSFEDTCTLTWELINAGRGKKSCKLKKGENERRN